MIVNSPAARPRGTTGYAEHAVDLIARYEELAPAYKHAEVLHLVPAAPSRVLDVGSGSGVDAAWLASMGHEVLAVEPTDAFRHYAEQHHASPRIDWLNDSLPSLARVVERRQTFALIMLTAVWMHLDEAERRTAMAVLAGLLGPEGSLVMAVRHGPVPEGRVMYEVPAVETIALASTCGLQCVLSVETESRQAANRDAGVTWSRLAFRSSTKA
jgi:protein-L-isoaspartate O-methyltransferase